MSFVIRSAAEKDIPFILDGYFKINEDNPMHTDKVLTAEKIRRDILSPEPKAWIDIAEQEGEAVGFVFYSKVYFASTGEVLWMTNIYVDPFIRRAGIARGFTDHLLAKYPECNGIYGVTETHNHTAQNAFTSLGAHLNPGFIFISLERKDVR